MNPECGNAVEATPLQLAFDGFATAFSHLVKVVDDGGLDGVGAAGLVGFLQDYETIRNRMPVIDHAAIRAGIDGDLPHELCQRSMGRVLTQALRISVQEAGTRVRAAEQLGERASMTGEPLSPLRPHLAAAQRRGEITPEQVTVVDKALRAVDGRGFDPAEVAAGEQILTDAAADLGPADLRQVAQQVVDAIDPDGTLPDDQQQRERRYFRYRRAPDGSVRGDFRLTPEAGAKLSAVLDPLAAPKLTSILLGAQPHDSACGGNSTADTGATGDTAGAGDTAGTGDTAGAGDTASPAERKVTEPDPRTRGQRLHDALEAVCDRLLRSDVLPDSGGTPATVILTIDADKLQARTGTGSFSDGTPVSGRMVADLADQADLAWCVKNTKGAVLSLGRDRRLASPAQTLGLIARDGGCSFPGCDIAPEWCERHHIISWIDGGATDLDNLTLLCKYHHHYFANRGWGCRMNADQLPVWIPPKWIDRHQHPILHPRIRINRWRAQQPLPGIQPP
jgi:hypothetical protein